jgi:hypothetical protein
MNIDPIICKTGYIDNLSSSKVDIKSTTITDAVITNATITNLTAPPQPLSRLVLNDDTINAPIEIKRSFDNTNTLTLNPDSSMDFGDPTRVLENGTGQGLGSNFGQLSATVNQTWSPTLFNTNGLTLRATTGGINIVANDNLVCTLDNSGINMDGRSVNLYGQGSVLFIGSLTNNHITNNGMSGTFNIGSVATGGVSSLVIPNNFNNTAFNSAIATAVLPKRGHYIVYYRITWTGPATTLTSLYCRMQFADDGGSIFHEMKTPANLGDLSGTAIYKTTGTNQRLRLQVGNDSGGSITFTLAELRIVLLYNN